MSATAPLKTQATRESGTIRNFRWYICGLLLYATTVNYMDRAVLGLLEPNIARDLHWSNSDYGNISAAFQIGYAVMMPLAGRLIDWIGLRIGYALSTLLWSISSLAHALAGNGFQFGVARLGLGLGEAANFPACIKAVADWFPKRERAFATGIFNGGSNLGAILAPLLVPLVYVNFGWRAAFIFTGSLSLTFVILWTLIYREPEDHPRLSSQELALIRSDQEIVSKGRVPYSHVIGDRAAWAFLVGKFLTDPVWWFYLFWLPGFLQRSYHVELANVAAPLVTVYAASAVGSVFGGWLSSLLIKHGWAIQRARQTAMLVCAVAVMAAMFVPLLSWSMWWTVALIGIATAAHQGWSANLYTVASDNFPRAAVASVVGLGGLGGAVGGALVQPAVGAWLDLSHNSYGPIFVICGATYLIALLIIHLLLRGRAGSSATARLA
ncbi:MAG TPA: MFS transporter [Bryobacteraceae bacterium]|jgi:ACS family hexuronate transporter-like MFS transporter|nr:MFS transporter [Bryobacteraceae bacterium]